MVMNNTIDNILKLKTEAGSIIFFLQKNLPESNIFDFDIKCEMNGKFVDLYPKASFCRLYSDDLRKLVQYFQNHCAGLENGSLFESPVYMPLEADFQIRCLDGDIEKEEGYFSLYIFFNCGKLTENGSNNYFGFESIIYLNDLKKFYYDINKLLSGSNSKNL